VAAIAVVNLVEGSRFGQAAAFAVVLMLLSLVATGVQLGVRTLILRSQRWRAR
jgi:iron(III) transport system permease protein